VVSHDLAVILRIADRVVVLDCGRVVEEATGTDLLRRPQHPVTRSLLAASGAPDVVDTAVAGVDHHDLTTTS
jgi:peptide/nickel transport system ATP-binding protein